KRFRRARVAPLRSHRRHHRAAGPAGVAGRGRRSRHRACAHAGRVVFDCPSRVERVMAKRQARRGVSRGAAGRRVGYGLLMRAGVPAPPLSRQFSLSVRGGAAATRAARSTGLPLTKNQASLDRADLLVVDDPSLKHGRPWIARAKRAGVLSVSVHDSVPAHDADLVICGSIGADEFQSAGTVLNGPQFYLLDRHIRIALRNRWSRTNARPMRVLVALGGGDHVRRVAQQLVHAIRRYTSNVSIVVAAGFSRGRRPSLRGAHWLSARTGLTQALVDCDVAIVAGGGTVYEARAPRTPTGGI